MMMDSDIAVVVETHFHMTVTRSYFFLDARRIAGTGELPVTPHANQAEITIKYLHDLGRNRDKLAPLEHCKPQRTVTT